MTRAPSGLSESAALLAPHFSGPDGRPVATIGEEAAAAALGICAKTLSREVSAGRASCRMVGKRRRYRIEDLLAYLAAGDGPAVTPRRRQGAAILPGPGYGRFSELKP